MQAGKAGQRAILSRAILQRRRSGGPESLRYTHLFPTLTSPFSGRPGTSKRIF